jgi:hypothetical protein
MESHQDNMAQIQERCVIYGITCLPSIVTTYSSLLGGLFCAHHCSVAASSNNLMASQIASKQPNNVVTIVTPNYDVNYRNGCKCFKSQRLYFDEGRFIRVIASVPE